MSYVGDRSIFGAGDSVSHISGLLGDDERLFNDGEVDRDVDASVRALRPRSSRRGSWESGTSGWSAAVTGGGYPRNRSLWTSNSIGAGDGLTLDEDDDDENDNDMTSVEGNVDNPIPDAAGLSVADTVSEITDDGKPRERSNTVTAGDDHTSSPLLTPTEPLPSSKLPDPSPRVDKEFADVQEKPRTSGELDPSVDEPQTSPERTPAHAVTPLPKDTQSVVISA
jgi:hypothetical protein